MPTTMNALENASAMLQLFRGDSLRQKVAHLEKSFSGVNDAAVKKRLKDNVITADLMRAALLVKRSASQIDNIVHALGILTALPHILEQDETVQSLSLAAGNTGKAFDLVTSKRIAEFTFIQWRGGPEVVRQNKIFKDFYFLAEEPTPLRRELYVCGTERVLAFLKGNRALVPILEANGKLGRDFRNRHGKRFQTVGEYYRTKKRHVHIVNLTPFLPIRQDTFVPSPAERGKR